MPPESAEIEVSGSIPSVSDDLLELCQHLRNKKMSYLPLAEALRTPSGSSDTLSPSLGNGNHHWCFHTQSPIGPDGGRVAATRCIPGRKCHCPY